VVDRVSSTVLVESVALERDELAGVGHCHGAALDIDLDARGVSREGRIQEVVSADHRQPTHGEKARRVAELRSR
jgi:hypothetical protein